MTIEEPFKTLEDGAYTYYAIQSRVTHLSPHNKPEAPLVSVEKLDDGFGRPYSREWHGMVGEYIAEPWEGSGNDYKPKHRKSHDEKHSVWAKTGGSGWWTLKYAVLAMRRLSKGSQAGKLNYKDGYNKVTQAVRYEFRIVKISVSKKVELSSANDLIEALAIGEAA